MLGANDDAAKYAADRGVAMYAEMKALGLEQVVIGSATGRATRW
jgi:hypothetical protein